MSLADAKLNTQCLVTKIEIEDEKTKLRLMELGLIEGTKIKVENKSALKQTMLVQFNSSCFTLKTDIAKKILINYV